MRILVLNTDYPKFLLSLYLQHPSLEDAGYDAQMAVRNDSLFGVADYYSRNFSALGHVAAEVHVNNRWMQYAWAREHGLAVDKPDSTQVAQDGVAARPSLLRQVKSILRPVLAPLVRKLRPPRMPQWEAALMAAQIADFKPDVILNQEKGKAARQRGNRPDRGNASG
jgi:spore maturation protein CgeB